MVRLGQVWCADITCLPMRRGLFSLVVIRRFGAPPIMNTDSQIPEGFACLQEDGGQRPADCRVTDPNHNRCRAGWFARSVPPHDRDATDPIPGGLATRSEHLSRSRFCLWHRPEVLGTAIGLVTYLCCSQHSFRKLGVRRSRGFCLPMLSADGAGYGSR